MDIKRKNIGPATIITLTLIPVLIWVFLQPLNSRFSNFSVGVTSIAQILGLMGMSLMSIAFMLSAKLKFTENYFGGLDKMYKWHPRVGATAFLFLIFHPLLLAYTYLNISLKESIFFIFPGYIWATRFGFVAILILSIILTITLLVKKRYIYIEYSRWKFMHKFIGIAFFFAALHVIFISSDISRSMILRYYLLGLVAMGFAAYTYRTLLGNVLIERLNYRVAEIKLINENITEVTLKPEKEALSFRAGQFLFVSFFGEGISKEVHPFTISSSSSEKNLRLSIKVSGEYTSKIRNLKVGTLAKVEGPFGRFSYQPYREKEQIWVAGGIGITPFLSMVRNLEGNKLIELYYSSREENVPFIDEINKVAEENNRFKVIPFNSKEKHIDVDFILQNSGNLKNKEIFMCGPKGMMTSLRGQFVNLGVDKENIHFEEFSFL